MKWKSLKELCGVNMGQSPSSTTYNYNGNGLPFYQGNADFGDLHPNTRVWCSSPVKVAEKDDILISVRAPIGALNVADKTCCIGRGLAALHPYKEFCDSEFLFYALKSLRVVLEAKGTGSTFKAINKKLLEDTPIICYELSRQRDIARVFSTLDMIIHKKKKKLELLEKLVKSRFIELFGDSYYNEKQWKKVRLKDVSRGALSYGSNSAAVEFDGKYRYLRITDILDNGVLGNEIKSPGTVNLKYLLKEGDILFARSGATVGKTFLYTQNVGKCIYAGYLIKFSPNLEKVLPTYVYYFTKTNYYLFFVSNAQKVVAQPNINAQQYGNLVIGLPPLKLQKQFSYFVTQVDKSKLAVRKSLNELEILKKSLMQKYFG